MNYIVVSESSRAACELVAAAKAQDAQAIEAVVFDGETAEVVSKCGIGKVLLAKVPEGALLESAASVVVDEARSSQEAVVLMSGSRRLVNCAGLIAGSLGTAPLVDAARGKDGAWSHMLYGGKVVVEEKSTGSFTVVIMQGAAYEPVSPDAAPCEIVEAEVDPAVGAKVLEVRPKEATSVDLTAAKRIVCIGRGVSTREGFDACRTLAGAMSAEMACTRPVTETEDPFMPRDTYIGASGIVVKPDLYVGVAASGQTQHTMGMYESGKVVAIDKNPNCPFFARADYGLVGDYVEVVDALTRALGA